jgi:hypothetical protein
MAIQKATAEIRAAMEARRAAGLGFCQDSYGVDVGEDGEVRDEGRCCALGAWFLAQVPHVVDADGSVSGGMVEDLIQAAAVHRLGLTLDEVEDIVRGFDSRGCETGTPAFNLGADLADDFGVRS